MNGMKGFGTLALTAVLLAGVAAAQDHGHRDNKGTHAQNHGQDHGQNMQLPAGWTQEDMQACMIAGTPGKEHERLAEGAGEWRGEGEMWMAPDSEPVPYQCTTKIDVVMDGRYVKCEMDGEMPGMGPFHGLGYNGYDNVKQQYVSTWMDNHSTAIMTGTGKSSDDGKTIEWTYEYTCPVTKKPTKMREIDKMTGDNTMTMVMYGTDPKSGKEFKMMSLTFTRKPGTGGVARASGH